MLPRARTSQLVTQPVGDELVVYDLKAHATHRLNRAAAILWRSCDGERTTAELASALAERTGIDVGEDIVSVAIARLRTAGLLEEPAAPRSADPVLSSRRVWLRR